MAKRAGSVVVLGVILAVSFIAPHNVWAFTAKFRQSMTGPDGSDIVYNVWMNDKKMRMETDFGGEKRVLIFKEDGSRYTYFPGRNLYVKMPGLPVAQSDSSNPVEFVKQLKSQQPENLGSETIDGYLCDVYRYRDANTSSIVTVWVWKEKEFPVKIGFAGGLVENTILFRNIEIDQPVADNIFEIPAGASEYNPDSLGAMFDEMQSSRDRGWE